MEKKPDSRGHLSPETSSVKKGLKVAVVWLPDKSGAGIKPGRTTIQATKENSVHFREEMLPNYPVHKDTECASCLFVCLLGFSVVVLFFFLVV